MKIRYSIIKSHDSNHEDIKITKIGFVFSNKVFLYVQLENQIIFNIPKESRNVRFYWYLTLIINVLDI